MTILAIFHTKKNEISSLSLGRVRLKKNAK